MNIRLTLLEWMEVVREDGESLGRLMDVRARGDRGPVARAEALAPDAMLVGARGWLERMGLRQGRTRGIPVNAIVAIESGKIIVRASSPAATREPAKRRRRR